METMGISSNWLRVEDLPSFSPAQQSITVERDREEKAGETFASLLTSQKLLSETADKLSLEHTFPLRTTITLSEEELRRFGVRGRKAKTIENMMKQFKKIRLEPGVLVEVSDGVYIGLTREGKVRVVFL